MRAPLMMVLATAAAVTALATNTALAVPYALTAADRAELTALARVFFDTTRDGAPRTSGIYPTPEEFRALFPAPPGAAGGRDGGVSAPDEVVNRQLRMIERDVREARARFAGGRFVGLAARTTGRPTLDLRPCGRFARADSQCGDGPTFEYEVNGATRRYRIDTVVRVRGHWRIFDVRP